MIIETECGILSSTSKTHAHNWKGYNMKIEELNRILSLENESSFSQLLEAENDCVKEYNYLLHRVNSEYDLRNEYALNEEKYSGVREHYEKELSESIRSFQEAETQLNEIRAEIRVYIMGV